MYSSVRRRTITHTELTNKELTTRLLEATGTGWERVERVQDRLGHDLRYSVEWYRTRRDWWEPLKQRAKLLR